VRRLLPRTRLLVNDAERWSEDTSVDADTLVKVSSINLRA
jgi:hypothetical protein